MHGRNIEKMMGAVALAAVTLSLLMAISAISLVHAQENVTGFSISPGDFTVRDAPPMGEPYRLEMKLRINNGDTIKRIFNIRVLIPDNLTPGYTAIPDNSWVVPIPQVIEIDENLPGENSFGLVDIYLNIPRWENLTSQKWEAWISVRRQAEIGEIGVEPEIVCRARIETSAELPPPPSQSEFPIMAIIALAIGIAAAVLISAVWIRYRGREGRARRRVF